RLTGCPSGDRSLRRPRGAVDVFIAVIRGQDDDSGLGMLPADDGDSLQAAHAAELEIHQCHVRSKATEKSDGLFPPCGNADHFHVRLSVDDQGNSFTDYPVIVDTEDA